VKQGCGAATKRGAACRSFVPPGREFCVSHDPSMAEAIATARIKGGTMAAKVRILEGKRLKLDSPSAVVKFTSNVVQDCLAGTVEVEIARTTLYGLGILLKAQEQARSSDVEAMLAEVRALTEQARRRA
jgi:hypothetical protein